MSRYRLFRGGIGRLPTARSLDQVRHDQIDSGTPISLARFCAVVHDGLKPRRWIWKVAAGFQRILAHYPSTEYVRQLAAFEMRAVLRFGSELAFAGDHIAEPQIIEQRAGCLVAVMIQPVPWRIVTDHHRAGGIASLVMRVNVCGCGPNFGTSTARPFSGRSPTTPRGTEITRLRVYNLFRDSPVGRMTIMDWS